MTVEDLHWFLNLFEELEVKVWLDGGWGVDALIGEQTRSHADLDIMIPVEDSLRLNEALRERDFEDVWTDDRVDENFVLGHPVHGQIDFHVFEPTNDGGGIYRPDVVDWKMTAEELAGSGAIGGRSVRCLSAEYQVRSHSGYVLKSSDLHDMKALHAKFGVKLLDEHLKALDL